MERLLFIASLHGGGEQRNCPRAVGSGTASVHCVTALELCDVPHCPTTLGGNGQYGLLCSPPHYSGAVGNTSPCDDLLTFVGQWAITLVLRWGNGQWNSLGTLPHCLEAVGSGISSAHYLTALGAWAIELLQHNALLPWGGGQRKLCSLLVHCLGTVGSEAPRVPASRPWKSGMW